MGKITPQRIAEIEARYPMIGRLRGVDIDDRMAGAVLRDMAISEMREHLGVRGAGQRNGGMSWPTVASQRQIETYGHRWYDIVRDLAVG